MNCRAMSFFCIIPISQVSKVSRLVVRTRGYSLISGFLTRPFPFVGQKGKQGGVCHTMALPLTF